MRSLLRGRDGYAKRGGRGKNIRNGSTPCLKRDFSHFVCHRWTVGFPGWLRGKESACRGRRCSRYVFDPWVGKIPCRRKGNPLRYSCLEDPRDRGAWWACSPRGHRVGFAWSTQVECGGPGVHVAALESGCGWAVSWKGAQLAALPVARAGPRNPSALLFLSRWPLSSVGMHNTLLVELGLEFSGNLSPAEFGNVVLVLSPFLGSKRFLNPASEEYKDEHYNSR